MEDFSKSNLDLYSRMAVKAILTRFPEWADFAKLTPRPDGGGNAVEFCIPCPSKSVDGGLWVSTADEELSVGFHTHHRHFTDYEHRLNSRQIEAGLQMVADILAETLGIVSWYRGFTFIGSFSLQLPHTEPLPGLFTGSVLLKDMLLRGDLATLRSWKGRFDRDETCNATPES